MIGGAGADKIQGNDGNDQLIGGAGDDALAGDAGVDSLNGGSGTDSCARDLEDAAARGCESAP